MERDGISTSISECAGVDVIAAYLEYLGNTESPAVFNRWSIVAAIGALLGRRYFFQLGHFTIYPNCYVMLMGSPGTRKTTSIKVATSLLQKAGYTKIAADRTTKEKFLLDLSGDIGGDVADAEDLLDVNLFGPGEEDAEILVAADEFNSFVGIGNIEFLSLLGVLWDYNGTFKNRVKNSKSIEILNPTVSILAGNTPTGFSMAFPPEAIGQGIFSRLLLVHGETTGKKITFPPAPTLEATAAMVALLLQMKEVAVGAAKLEPAAQAALDTIYKSWKGIADVRFESYANRRFSHLIKLCLICSAARLSNTISLEDVIYANTILTHTEHSMPKALGEFGKAKHSDVAHKLLQYLESQVRVVTVKELWKQVHNDLEDIKNLRDLLANLTIADKIITAQGGYLARRVLLEESSSLFVDFTKLSEEERSYIS